MLLQIVNQIDTPPEWGIVGVIVFIALTLLSVFVWWVRAARSDLTAAFKQTKEAQTNTMESQDKFVSYLKDTGERTVTALVASTGALQATTEALHAMTVSANAHEQRAADRHSDVTHRLDRIEYHVMGSGAVHVSVNQPVAAQPAAAAPEVPDAGA